MFFRSLGLFSVWAWRRVCCLFFSLGELLYLFLIFLFSFREMPSRHIRSLTLEDELLLHSFLDFYTSLCFCWSFIIAQFEGLKCFIPVLSSEFSSNFCSVLMSGFESFVCQLQFLFWAPCFFPSLIPLCSLLCRMFMPLSSGVPLSLNSWLVEIFLSFFSYMSLGLFPVLLWQMVSLGSRFGSRFLSVFPWWFRLWAPVSYSSSCIPNQPSVSVYTASSPRLLF